MRLLIIVASYFILSLFYEPIHGTTEGIYWRQFTGVVPLDAFPGGRESNGRVTFIGQTLFKNFLVPGEIRPAENRIYFEFGNAARTATDFIMILCTSTPERLSWKSTTKSDISYLSKDKLVEGGYEGEPYYIARSSAAGGTVVGKVYDKALRLGVSSTDYRYVTAFEVLWYEGGIPLKNTNKKIRITIH